MAEQDLTSDFAGIGFLSDQVNFLQRFFFRVVCLECEFLFLPTNRGEPGKPAANLPKQRLQCPRCKGGLSCNWTIQTTGQDESEEAWLKVPLASLTFSAPGYSGTLKRVFDKITIEIQSKAIGPPRMITLLPTIEKKGEVIDYPQTWKRAANKATLEERMEGYGKTKKNGFNLHNYDNLWFDPFTPREFISIQLTLMFWRWDLLTNSESLSALKIVRQFLARVYSGVVVRTESVDASWKSEIIDELVFHVFTHFRFPEGPYDVWSYCARLIEVEIRRHFKERVLTRPGERELDLEESQANAAERLKIRRQKARLRKVQSDLAVPNSCYVPEAADFLGCDQRTIYNWIERRTHNIQVNKLNGITVISQQELMRIKELTTKREEMINHLMNGRGIKRESAIRRLQRLARQESTSTHHDKSRVPKCGS